MQKRSRVRTDGRSLLALNSRAAPFSFWQTLSLRASCALSGAVCHGVHGWQKHGRSTQWSCRMSDSLVGLVLEHMRERLAVQDVVKRLGLEIGPIEHRQTPRKAAPMCSITRRRGSRMPTELSSIVTSSAAASRRRSGQSVRSEVPSC